MAVAPSPTEPPSPVATPISPSTTSAPASPPDGEGDSQVLESLVEEDADENSFDAFDAFDDKLLTGVVDADEPAPVSPASSAEVPPVVAPSPAQVPGSPPVPPVPAEVAPPVPVPPAVAPAAPPTSEQPAPGASPAPPAQDATVVYTAWRTNAEKELAEGHFALPKELVEQMEADPGKFASETLPRLAAKVYLDAVTAAVSAIQGYMPGYIGQQLEQRTAMQAAEEKFFSSWPQLDRGKHTAKITEIGRTWRAMNPKGSAEDYIKNVGALAVLNLGLPFQAAPAAPAGPVVVAPRPHAPIAHSAPRSGPSPMQQESPWDMTPEPDED